MRRNDGVEPKTERQGQAMASGTGDTRPVSPHLQVWRWHITMATSILHRATGVALYGGAVLVTAWLVALASGPQVYATVEGLFLSLFGQVVLFAFTLAATYHMANGVRHLVWDAGHGFTPGVANMTSHLVFVFALVATLGVWAAAYWL